MALREQVVKKLKTLKNRSLMAPPLPGDADGSGGRVIRTSNLIKAPSLQPAKLILDQLTSLQVCVEGSEKVISSGFDNKAKSFTKYRISVCIDGRRWIVSRRYSEFHNMSTFLLFLLFWGFWVCYCCYFVVALLLLCCLFLLFLTFFSFFFLLLSSFFLLCFV